VDKSALGQRRRVDNTPPVGDSDRRGNFSKLTRTHIHTQAHIESELDVRYPRDKSVHLDTSGNPAPPPMPNRDFRSHLISGSGNTIAHNPSFCWRLVCSPSTMPLQDAREAAANEQSCGYTARASTERLGERRVRGGGSGWKMPRSDPFACATSFARPRHIRACPCIGRRDVYCRCHVSVIDRPLRVSSRAIGISRRPETKY